MKKSYINGIGCISAQKTVDSNFLSEIEINTTETVLNAKQPSYTEVISPSFIRRMAKGVKMGIFTSTQALKEANLAVPDAIITGTGLGCLEDSEKFLKAIEVKFPGIRETIKSIHASTPLSYRDYIGGDGGNMYGYVKDSNNPMKTMIPTKTKVENLYLTGQSINMHGVLGVTVGAVITCSEIVGKEYLLEKIKKASE